MSWVPRSLCSCSVTFSLIMSHSFPTVSTTTVGGTELSGKQRLHASGKSNNRERRHNSILTSAQNLLNFHVFRHTSFIIHRKQNACVEKYTDTTGRKESLINPSVAKNMTELDIFLTEMVLQSVLYCHWKAVNCHCMQRGYSLASCSTTEVPHRRNLFPDILLAARTCSVCLF